MWMFVVLVGGQASVAAAEEEETGEDVEALKRRLELQDQSIQELRRRLDAFELHRLGAEPAGIAPAVAEEATSEQPVTEPGKLISPAEEEEKRLRATYGRPSPIRFTGSFEDRQTAAARPGDFELDPEFRGFSQIGDTVFLLKFNPRPRVDLTADTQNTGNDFRFVPAHIPVEGDPARGGGLDFNMNGNGSQIRVDMRAPSMEGNFRLYYQNDFFGSDDSHFRYRLQHFYGQYYGVLGGFTYGVFEDPDAWPDTVDYEGPNSVIFARRPVLHYTHSLSDEFNVTVGVEDPDIFLDTTGDPEGELRARAPDTGFNARWESADHGHVQFSTIFRAIGIDGDTVDDDDVFGWGLGLSGGIDLTEQDRVVFWGVYGFGIGGMGNDSSFVDADAALDSDGDLRALEYISGMLAFTHRWSERWRSTGTYGYVNLSNAGSQADDAYDKTQYASVNLVYQLYKRLSIGVEGLYGYNKVKDGDSGDVFRIQMGVVYSLFD